MKYSESESDSQNSESSGNSLISVNYLNPDHNAEKVFASHDYWTQFSTCLYAPEHHRQQFVDRANVVKLPSLYKTNMSSYQMLYLSLRNLTEQATLKRQNNEKVINKETQLCNYGIVIDWPAAKLISKQQISNSLKKIIYVRRKKEIEIEVGREKENVKSKDKLVLQKKQIKLQDIINDNRSRSADKFQGFYQNIGYKRWGQEKIVIDKPQFQSQIKQMMNYKQENPLKDLLEINREISPLRQKKYKQKNKILFEQSKIVYVNNTSIIQSDLSD